MYRKKTIDKFFAPISKALLKEGKKTAATEYKNIRVVGYRLNNRPRANCPAWSPYYDVHMDGEHVCSGKRDWCVDWMYRRLNGLKPEAITLQELKALGLKQAEERRAREANA